jgi:hypothetical protein
MSIRIIIESTPVEVLVAFMTNTLNNTVLINITVLHRTMTFTTHRYCTISMFSKLRISFFTTTMVPRVSDVRFFTNTLTFIF